MNIYDDDLYVDFKSLKNNEDWKNVYKLYKFNIISFSKIIKKIMKDYSITKQQARDIVLFEIMSAYYGTEHKKILSSKNKLKWSLIYIVSMIGIFLNGLLSILTYKKIINVNILYEEMFSSSGWNTRFYQYITKEIKNKSVKEAMLYTHPGVNKDFFNGKIENWKGMVINRRATSLLFSFESTIKVFSDNLLYCLNLYKLSSNINITYIYLRIIRKYLVYNSQMKNIKADCIVAAGDYYWNPLKYIIYKKNIKNIILLQHNYKNEFLHNTLFQYCDFYFAHSEQAMKRQEGIPFAEKYSIGSFQLIPFLDPVENEYDIVFINQTVNDDLNNFFPDFNKEKLIENYYILIENFMKYLESYDNIKAIYIAKGETIDSEPSSTVKSMFSTIKNIEFEGTYGPRTFEVIKKSKLVINMYSSVGFEAYGFDKKVLWINYHGCCDYFKYDMDKESLHVLRDLIDYNTFEERVNLLLSSNREVDEYYVKLKEKYMNIQGNPAIAVVNKINELLGN